MICPDAYALELERFLAICQPGCLTSGGQVFGDQFLWDLNGVLPRLYLHAVQPLVWEDNF